MNVVSTKVEVSLGQQWSILLSDGHLHESGGQPSCSVKSFRSFPPSPRKWRSTCQPLSPSWHAGAVSTNVEVFPLPAAQSFSLKRLLHEGGGGPSLTTWSCFLHPSSLHGGGGFPWTPYGASEEQAFSTEVEVSRGTNYPACTRTKPLHGRGGLPAGVAHIHSLFLPSPRAWRSAGDHLAVGDIQATFSTGVEVIRWPHACQRRHRHRHLHKSGGQPLNTSA